MNKYILDNSKTWQQLQNKMSFYQFTSLQYSDFEDVLNYEVNEYDDFIILLGYQNNKYHLEWMANEPTKIISIINNYPKPLLMKFIPLEWVTMFKSIGFIEYGYLHSYWIKDIEHISFPKITPQIILESDCPKVASITRNCYLQSREFEGESDEWTFKWLNNDTNDNVRLGTIICEKENEEIVGVAYIGIYGKEENPVLWLRELAVDPSYQNKGYGKKLIYQSLNYGLSNGAKRSFLMADDLNIYAINLYKKIGYIADEDDYQIDLILNN